MIEIFANLATTTLAGPISAGATAVNLAAGTGALFPNPAPGVSYFMMTFQDSATGLVHEIVQVTARTTDTCTIVRGQEGTSGAAWLAGDLADNRWTAGSAATMIQVAQLQQQAGNYAVDTGSVNTYAVTLNPVPSSLSFLIGVPIRVKIANTNTGASSFSANGLSAVVKNPDGTGLINGQLVAGGIAIFTYDGSAYELLSTPGYHPGFTNGGSFGPSGSLGGSGTTPWTVPAGVTRVRARVWGAGGPGGGSAGNPSAASGGGGAGYTEGIYTVTPGQVISVTAGVAGTPGAALSNNNATASAGSAFGAFCSATAGGLGNGAALNGYQTIAGANGSPTGGNVLNLVGTNGQAGTNIGTLGLGGGGGSAYSGAGSPPNTGSATNASQPGGGGAGGANGGGGGVGGTGIVLLDW
jgi:hypothetical protein